MRRRKDKKKLSPLPILCGVFLVLALIGLTVGLTVGLNARNTIVITTTATIITTTTTTTTTVAPTTPPPSTTCDSNYTFQIQPLDTLGQQAFFGQYAEYYVAGDSFVYMFLDDARNITLASRNKTSSFIANWNVTLCQYATASPLEYITVNQTNGDIYFAYVCDGPLFVFVTFMDKYDSFGNLVWHMDISNANNATGGGGHITTLASPLALDSNQVYFTFFFTNGTTSSRMCALNAASGSFVWCIELYQNIGGLVLSSESSYIYEASYNKKGADPWPKIFKYDRTSGALVASGFANNTRFLISLGNDASGNVYSTGILFVSGLNNPAIITKYDSSLIIQWQLVLDIVAPIPTAYASTYNQLNLLYDPNVNVLIASGDISTTNDVDFIRAWLATINPSNGTLLSYFETPVTAVYNLQFVSTTPFYQERTIFYMYEVASRSDSNKFYNLSAFCY